MRATVSVIGGKGMLVSPAENARRLAICDTCESVERIREYRRCQICKCWLAGWPGLQKGRAENRILLAE